LPELSVELVESELVLVSVDEVVEVESELVLVSVVAVVSELVDVSEELEESVDPSVLVEVVEESDEDVLVPESVLAEVLSEVELFTST
jgi:hypothetical protein